MKMFIMERSCRGDIIIYLMSIILYTAPFICSLRWSFKVTVFSKMSSILSLIFFSTKQKSALSTVKYRTQALCYNYKNSLLKLSGGEFLYEYCCIFMLLFIYFNVF